MSVTLHIEEIGIVNYSCICLQYPSRCKKMQETSTDEVPLPSYIDKKTIDKLIQEGNNVINTQFTTGNEINIENHLDRKVK